MGRFVFGDLAKEQFGNFKTKSLGFFSQVRGIGLEGGYLLFLTNIFGGSSVEEGVTDTNWSHKYITQDANSD